MLVRFGWGKPHIV